MASVPATREVLQRFGMGTKKALGQHFLVNDGVVRHICRLAEVGPGDDILEIGPGIGTLTCALLACGARVVAVERDADLLPVLQDTCGMPAEGAGAGSLVVMNRDALNLAAADLPFAPAKLVANLPYAVAATLVLQAFENLPSMHQATVMVQHEVAQRMAARPGTKDYGAFTVKLALHAQTAERFNVAPGSFFPPPRVTSTVIRLNRTPSPTAPQVVRAACTMADAAFANRRKTIANSCRSFFAAQGRQVDVALLLQRARIEPSCRGELLKVQDYLALGRALHDLSTRGA